MVVRGRQKRKSRPSSAVPASCVGRSIPLNFLAIAPGAMWAGPACSVRLMLAAHAGIGPAFAKAGPSRPFHGPGASSISIEQNPVFCYTYGGCSPRPLRRSSITHLGTASTHQVCFARARSVHVHQRSIPTRKRGAKQPPECEEASTLAAESSLFSEPEMKTSRSWKRT
jgi:hypothetical protein